MLADEQRKECSTWGTRGKPDRQGVGRVVASSREKGSVCRVCRNRDRIPPRSRASPTLGEMACYWLFSRPMDLKIADAPNPHFARIGGETEVRRLVDAFYRRMETLPEAASIRAMHGPDLEEIKATLLLHLVEWLGGPKEYSARRGPPRLRARHLRFPIGPAERDAWMLCMRGALEEVVADVELRAELERAFLRTANAVVNR